MKISLSHQIAKNQSLILFVFEKEKSPCGMPKATNLVDLAGTQGFKGKFNSTVVLHPKSGSPAQQVILVGLGDKSDVKPECVRRATAGAVKKVASLSQKSFSIVAPNVLGDAKIEAGAIADGALLATYKFDKYKSAEKDAVSIKELTIVLPLKDQSEAKKGISLAQVMAESTALVRDLVNEPPSELTPSKFAEIAQEVAEKGASAGITITLYDKKQIEEMKMGALLGVNRGSAEPPVFIHMHYKPEGAIKSIALVGKGITFDSGGLSLKPAASMETMKMDMAGAASILGVFKAIPKIKPNIEIHGIMALTENMPGGRASKPGDISRAMNGKTIEVLNTDAEGRLILADALCYAVKQNPNKIIDLATLTGACITALGSLVAGVFSNNDEFFTEIDKAGKATGEKLWRMPLVREYAETIKSPIADLQNISSVRGEAGAIIGALFLQEFVNEKPWMHIDIAGPAWSNKPFHYLSQGGTGFPVRTLIQHILNS